MSDGPARPLGYPKADILTRGEPAVPSIPGPPWKVARPFHREGWADTGSAGSVDIDSGSPTVATLGLTNVKEKEEVVAATGATSSGSTSLP